jgi:plasmid stability protein
VVVIDGSASIDYIAVMATLSIRNLPDEVRDELRVAAAKNGRSMEAEARATLVMQFSKAVSKEREVEDIRARLRRVQADFAKHVPDRPSLADEFLAERKQLWGEE